MGPLRRRKCRFNQFNHEFHVDPPWKTTEEDAAAEKARLQGVKDSAKLGAELREPTSPFFDPHK
jgi:hypothetical protein